MILNLVYLEANSVAVLSDDIEIDTVNELESITTPTTPIKQSTPPSFETPSKNPNELTPQSQEKLKKRERWSYETIPTVVLKFAENQWNKHETQILFFFSEENRKNLEKQNFEIKTLSDEIDYLNLELESIKKRLNSNKLIDDDFKMQEQQLKSIKKQIRSKKIIPDEITNSTTKDLLARDNLMKKIKIVALKRKNLVHLVQTKPQDITFDFYLDNLIHDPAHRSVRTIHSSPSFDSKPANSAIESQSLQELFAIIRAVETKKILGPIVRGPREIEFYDLSTGNPIDVKRHINKPAKEEPIIGFIERTIIKQIKKKNLNFFSNEEVFTTVLLDVGVTKGKNYNEFLIELKNHPDFSELQNYIILVNPEGD